jgi:hypothetical protein
MRGDERLAVEPYECCRRLPRLTAGGVLFGERTS